MISQTIPSYKRAVLRMGLWKAVGPMRSCDPLAILAVDTGEKDSSEEDCSDLAFLGS